MARKVVTRYMVRTTDYAVIVKQGFITWNEAYEWAMTHDYGQYAEHGRLCVVRYTTRID